MSILQRFALLCGIWLLALPCSAQPGPFDDVTGIFGAPPAAQPAEQPEPELAETPLSRQLLEHAGRGNEQMADSIASLARIGRWQDVQRLLARLAGKSINAPALAEMSKRIGPDTLLRIKLHEDFSDSAKAGIERLEKAAVAEAESPARLQKAIVALGSQSLDARLGAMRVLLGGGNAAVAELVTAAVSEDLQTPRDEVLRVLLQFGKGGVQSLRQLALYGTPPVRHRAIESLCRIDPRAYAAELVTAAHAADSSDAELKTARMNLQRLEGGVPSRESALEILKIDFQRQREKARLTDNDDQTVTLWSVNADRTGVTHQPTQMVLEAYRDVADAASRLRRIGGLSSETAGAVLAADMAYRLMIDIDWGDPEQIEAIRKTYGSFVDASALSAAIEQATDGGDHTATIGLIRLVDPENVSVLDLTRLLASSGATPTPLVKAASSPEPRVRYEAALLVARLAQGKPYAGSSDILRCLSEMNSLADEPSAILVETRSEIIIPLEKLLGDLGMRVEVASTVRELQRCVARGGDLRLVLAKTELADLHPIELVDLVRRLGRGRELPIALYGSEPASISSLVAGIGSIRWQAPTVWIDPPASPAALHDLLDRVKRARRLPPLSVIDRHTYRQAAKDLLSDSPQAW